MSWYAIAQFSSCTLCDLGSYFLPFSIRQWSAKLKAQEAISSYIIESFSIPIMSFRSYKGPYLPSGDQLHAVMKIRALYSIMPNAMAKPVQKHHVVESNVTWMDICSGACESKQNGWRVRQYSCRLNSVSSRRGCFTKNPCYKSSDCSAEAIGRSSWPICYCLEKLNQTHARTTTVTLRCMRAEG